VAGVTPAPAVTVAQELTSLSAPFGQLVILAGLVAALVVMLRWWWQNRRR
jgi:hypothetical protein